jgi:hypothetical protein
MMVMRPASRMHNSESPSLMRVLWNLARTVVFLVMFCVGAVWMFEVAFFRDHFDAQSYAKGLTLFLIAGADVLTTAWFRDN